MKIARPFIVDLEPIALYRDIPPHVATSLRHLMDTAANEKEIEGMQTIVLLLVRNERSH